RSCSSASARSARARSSACEIRTCSNPPIPMDRMRAPSPVVLFSLISSSPRSASRRHWDPLPVTSNRRRLVLARHGAVAARALEQVRPLAPLPQRHVIPRLLDVDVLHRDGELRLALSRARLLGHSRLPFGPAFGPCLLERHAPLPLSRLLVQCGDLRSACQGYTPASDTSRSRTV